MAVPSSNLDYLKKLNEVDDKIEKLSEKIEEREKLLFKIQLVVLAIFIIISLFVTIPSPIKDMLFVTSVFGIPHVILDIFSYIKGDKFYGSDM